MEEDAARAALTAAVAAERAADEARSVARAEMRRALAAAREVLSLKECSAIVGVNASRISQLVREAGAPPQASTREVKARAGQAGGRARAEQSRVEP